MILIPSLESKHYSLIHKQSILFYVINTKDLMHTIMVRIIFKLEIT